MKKRRPGGGRKQGASSKVQLIRGAIGIALDLLFIDASPTIKGKTARWAAVLAEPNTTSLVEIKDDTVRLQLESPPNLTPERVDVIGKNLRQRLNGTASNSSLTQEQGEFVCQAAEVVFAILASRSLYVSQQFGTALEGWPPGVVQHLREFALCLNANNPDYLSPMAALSDPLLRIFTRSRT